MPTETEIVTEGTIIAVLPGTLFRVELNERHVVLAHISGKMRKRFIRLNRGDRVRLELSPYDLTKARISSTGYGKAKPCPGRLLGRVAPRAADVWWPPARRHWAFGSRPGRRDRAAPRREEDGALLEPCLGSLEPSDSEPLSSGWRSVIRPAGADFASPVKMPYPGLIG